MTTDDKSPDPSASFDDEVASVIDATAAELAQKTALRSKRLESWERANALVKEFKPVPWMVWKIVRGVLGRRDVIGHPHPQSFAVLDRLIQHAVVDPTFDTSFSGSAHPVSLSDAVKALGDDVAAALCYVHAICRRVGHLVPERIWRPILDDALIRARIGYYVGGYCKPFGRGRGMLAGFSGRSGLAILIAAGTKKQAQQMLEALAVGTDINEAGLKIYGCEPLQVAALTLTASGTARDSALGIASYSIGGQGIEVGTPGERSEQYRWLSAFAICEELRMNRADAILEDYWSGLIIPLPVREKLVTDIKRLHRKGHGWSWVTWPQVAMERPT